MPVLYYTDTGYPDEEPTMELRFVKRDGVCVLQQKWRIAYRVFEKDFDGEAVKEQWVNVPVEDED